MVENEMMSVDMESQPPMGDRITPMEAPEELYLDPEGGYPDEQLGR